MTDPDAPEFAAIRADLARLFITHKLALGLESWSDDEIMARTSDITAALIGLSQHALAHGDREWLERHQWFSDATERLFADQCAVRLDG